MPALVAGILLSEGGRPARGSTRMIDIPLSNERLEASRRLRSE